jgi:hypothetical protein
MANSPREQGETDMILGTTKTAQAGVGTPYGLGLTPDITGGSVKLNLAQPACLDPARG